jgi:hypothetical protein
MTSKCQPSLRGAVASPSPSLDKSIHSYALAAAASGVSLLALASPAEAKIVYTPSDISIPANSGFVQFDLNHDGVPDFGLSFHVSAGTSAKAPVGLYRDYLQVEGVEPTDQVRGFVSSLGRKCGARLKAGVEIGAQNKFAAGELLMFYVKGDGTSQLQTYGPWVDRSEGYLGLKFVVNGETHYGWARVSVVNNANVTLRGYAFETTANESIAAGATSDLDDGAASLDPAQAGKLQPASLGLLSRGSLTLSAWRGQETR